MLCKEQEFEKLLGNKNTGECYARNKPAVRLQYDNKSKSNQYWRILISREQEYWTMLCKTVRIFLVELKICYQFITVKVTPSEMSNVIQTLLHWCPATRQVMSPNLPAAVIVFNVEETNLLLSCSMITNELFNRWHKYRYKNKNMLYISNT